MVGNMEKASSVRLAFVFVLLVSSISAYMAEDLEKSGHGVAAGESTAVHIVYVDRPESEEPEAFHIRTLASVVGSEDAAREALIYHYTHAASGFSARLTPKQASDLQQDPRVLQVMADRTVQLHSGPGAAAAGGGGGGRLHHMGAV